MRLKQVIATGAVFLAFGTVSVLAEGDTDWPKIYSQNSSANYCPTGLQPVTMAGEISCGEANQSMTYQQVMAHGSSKRRARTDCPVGTKGCTFN